MVDNIMYLEIVFRLFLSVLFGAVIGHERESKNRPAGIRTYTLVCVSSTAIMILSEFIFEQYFIDYNLVSDPMRLGAQVISGIGFLGAGTIMHHGATVRGLTTAAGLWAVMTLGLIIGSGFYFLGVILFIAVYVVLVYFSKLPSKISGETDITMELKLKTLNNPQIIGDVSLCISNHNGKLLEMNFSDFQEKDSENDDDIEFMEMMMTIKITSDVYIDTIINELKSLENVINVEKIKIGYL